jgi:hypothetical protein
VEFYPFVKDRRTESASRCVLGCAHPARDRTNSLSEEPSRTGPTAFGSATCDWAINGQTFRLRDALGYRVSGRIEGLNPSRRPTEARIDAPGHQGRVDAA